MPQSQHPSCVVSHACFYQSNNEPVETSIEFVFDGKSNEKMKELLFQPNEQHEIHICLKDCEVNGSSLTKINTLEVFPEGLSVHR